MGYTSTTAQLFTVPPNMAAFFTVLITAYYSDKLKNRGYFIVGGAIVGVCGYIMLLVATTNSVRYAGTFLVAIGVFQGSPMIMVSNLPQQWPHIANSSKGLDI
jgi:sugar phosphate permease|tara:strand:- start:6748 stop:7056 length:309 start_codon:yes stop_codon:yes gene_type:complete